MLLCSRSGASGQEVQRDTRKQTKSISRSCGSSPHGSKGGKKPGTTRENRIQGTKPQVCEAQGKVPTYAARPHGYYTPQLRPCQERQDSMPQEESTRPTDE